MSLLIATPAYGGIVTLAYHQSVLRLAQCLPIEHDFLHTANESLIQRARNTTTATFLRTEFQKLLFIDSDIEFQPEDVAALWNADVPLAVAPYPMKRPDCPLSAWVDGKLVTVEGDEPFNVDYAGTGFMMIDRAVFEAFVDRWPERKHEEGHVGECFSWFDPRVEDGIYLSEDYAFCKDARTLGYDVVMLPRKLRHWGSFAYGG